MNNLIDSIEKSGCFRFAAIAGVIITILSGIVSLLIGNTVFAIGSILATAVFASIVMLITGLTTSTISSRSTSAYVKKTMNQIREDWAAEKQPAIKKTDTSQDDSPEVTPTKIGWRVGIIYGLLPGLIAAIATSSLVFGGMIIGVSGLSGIMSAHIGWQFPRSNQAKWAGLIGTVIGSTIALALIGGDIGFGFFAGILLSPIGWFSAKKANLSRFSTSQQP